jgi:putative membrane protein
MLLSAAGWHAVSGAAPAGSSRPGLGTLLTLRWVREGINNLLPVAQIGGEVVGARLLARGGMRLPEAIAATICDLTLETVTQIVFAVLGLALLPAGRFGGAVSLAGIGLACLLVCGFVAVQIGGGAGLLERLLLRMGEAVGRHEFRAVKGMEAALRRRYRAAGPLLRGAAWHLLSWLSGAVEVFLILHALGFPADLRTALLLESLGQAVKSIGFAVPGAIGVQEGGYAAIAAALGLPPGLGVAISLIKRLREIVFGVPALALWRLRETRAAPHASSGHPSSGHPSSWASAPPPAPIGS